MFVEWSLKVEFLTTTLRAPANVDIVVEANCRWGGGRKKEVVLHMSAGGVAQHGMTRSAKLTLSNPSRSASAASPENAQTRAMQARPGLSP